jgi:hypothetical protein
MGPRKNQTPTALDEFKAEEASTARKEAVLKIIRSASFESPATKKELGKLLGLFNLDTSLESEPYSRHQTDAIC